MIFPIQNPSAFEICVAIRDFDVCNRQDIGYRLAFVDKISVSVRDLTYRLLTSHNRSICHMPGPPLLFIRPCITKQHQGYLDIPEQH